MSTSHHPRIFLAHYPPFPALNPVLAVNNPNLATQLTQLAAVTTLPPAPIPRKRRVAWSAAGCVATSLLRVFTPILFFAQPQQTANVDPTKADAIRRTIYVGNVPQIVTEEELISFFTPCGSVKFVRVQGDPTAPSKYYARCESFPCTPFFFPSIKPS
jgi:hypothetical protein